MRRCSGFHLLVQSEEVVSQEDTSKTRHWHKGKMLFCVVFKIRNQANIIVHA